MTGIMGSANLLLAPFRGLRYADAEALGQRLAPPYDVITPAMRKDLVKQDLQNIVNLDLPSAPPGEDPYAYAADLLDIWQRRGTLVREAEPSAYVLRTTSTLADGRVMRRTGVFLAVAALPFTKGGRVRPHERTHAGPKEDRRKLTLATGCNLSPIFLLAPDSRGDIAATLEKVTREAPWATAEALGGTHEVWIVRGPIAMRLSLLASDQQLYIADGHHRYETAVYLQEDRQLPKQLANGAKRTLAHVVSFKDPGLAILATHRIVEGKPLSRSAVLKAANPYFARALPGQVPTLTAVFADGSEAAMMLRPDADLSAATDLAAHPSVRSLAVAIADAVFIKLVVEPLLKRAPMLRYTPVESEAREASKEPKVALSVLLPPTKIEEVQAVSDAGEFMPPKSTFFAPKVPTGIVMRPLEGEV
ncbi:MAG TPA: DUF1015 domain-containing protein [Gemmatimonadales bacterium]